MNEDELIAPDTLLKQKWFLWGLPWASSDEAGLAILAGNEDPQKATCIAGTEDSTGECYSNNTAAAISQHIVDLHNAWLRTNGTFNINEYVYVQLTEAGKAEHKRQYDKILESFPNLGAYTPPQEDQNGWSKWQLWSLMNTFGHMTYSYGDLMFKTEIMFSKPKG